MSNEVLTSSDVRVPLSRNVILFVVGGIAACTAGLASTFAVAVTDLPAMALFALPFAVLFGVAFLANAQFALYSIAFAIGPLGVVTVEIADVTLNFPEMLILLLSLKEGVLFFVRRESPTPFVNFRTLGLFLLVSCLAVLTGIARGNGIVLVLQDFRQFTEFMLLYILVAHRTASIAECKRILAAYLLGCTLLAAHGIVQRFTGWGIPLNQLLHDTVRMGGTRVGSFYGATPLGGLMILAFGCGMALLLSTRSRQVRILLVVLVLSCLSALVFTETRASWISLAFGCLVLFLGIKKRPSIVLALILAAVTFTFAFGPLVVGRLSSLSFSKAEQSLHERVQFYTVAWHIFREHPLLGLGWGCYYEVSSILVNERLVQSLGLAENLRAEDATVHSAYLQLLVKSGTVGLLGFALVIWSWLKRVILTWRKRPREETTWNVFAGVSTGVLAYLVHSAFENFFQWPVMAQSFWLLLAVSTCLSAELLGDRVPLRSPATTLRSPVAGA